MQGNNEVREETLGSAAGAQPSATVQNVGCREMQTGHFPILQDGQHWVLPKMLLLSCLFASALLPLHLRHLLLISSVWCRALPPVWLPKAVGGCPGPSGKQQQEPSVSVPDASARCGSMHGLDVAGVRRMAFLVVPFA